MLTHECPVCVGRHFARFAFGLVRCTACGLVVSPEIWKAGTNELMEKEWFGDDYKARISMWVQLFEKWNNRRTLRRLQRAGCRGGRLLEIGVGSGSFLQAARESGFQVVGCDLSQPICSKVRDEYGIEMLCGSIDALGETHVFDVVVMNHVLEHVHEPVKFMQSVARALVPGGIAHVAVPNLACLEASLPGWTSYEPYHLSYFVPLTLTRVVMCTEMGVESMETHESFSGWFLAVLRTIAGVNNLRVANRTSGESPAQNKPVRMVVLEHLYRIAMVALGAVTWPLREMQGRLGRGDELVCIARKPGHYHKVN